MGIERQTIKIGRGADNNIQINKPDISEYHVKITRTDNNSFFVEDLGSLNGTYVDDVPVRKVTIGAEDKLRISKDTYVDIKKIFNISSSDTATGVGSSIYIEDFYKLKELWDETERQKKRIKKKHQLKTSFIRAGITVGVVLIAIPFLGQQFILASVAGGAIGGAFVSMSPPEELRTLDERFQLKYNCPHCKKRLGQFSWNYYSQKGECPMCNKSFYK